MGYATHNTVTITWIIAKYIMQCVHVATRVQCCLEHSAAKLSIQFFIHCCLYKKANTAVEVASLQVDRATFAHVQTNTLLLFFLIVLAADCSPRAQVHVDEDGSGD